MYGCHCKSGVILINCLIVLNKYWYIQSGTRDLPGLLNIVKLRRSDSRDLSGLLNPVGLTVVIIINLSRPVLLKYFWYELYRKRGFVIRYRFFNDLIFQENLCFLNKLVF
jgi:hypothetical protein